MSIAMRIFMVLCGISLVFALGCPDKNKVDSTQSPTPTQPKSAAVTASAPSSAPAANKMDGAQAEKSCLGAFASSGEAKEIEIAGKNYQFNGDVMSLKNSDGDERFIFGQITDVKEDTPENLGNVRSLLQWMAQQKVDALVVTGDLGESQPTIEKVMLALAEFNGPVFVMIGNREGITDFEKAYAAVAPNHKNLINMNKIRIFNADDASLISLPGYFNPAYIHSQDGCKYASDDVLGLEKIMKEATSTVVLASHGPPHQDSVTGIDRIHEGVNVGDPVLARFMAEKRIRIGMFGNIHEAGGKATDLTGSEEIKAETFVEELLLNPGPADSVRWPLLDGTESVGMGGVLIVEGKKAQYKIRRLRPGEAQPVKAANVAPAPAQNPKAE